MPPSGTIKYRAACDHCSTTKIKCSQERPQCARCRALGRDCHYSRSLRAGKPPRSSQGLYRKLSNAPVLPRHNSIPEHGPLIQTNYPGYPNHYYSPISPGTKQDPTWTAHATPYPTPPAHGPNGNSEIPFFPDFATSDCNPSSGSSLDPEWLFDFNKSAHLLTDTRASSLDSNMTTTTQTSSPDSDGHRTPPDFLDLGSLQGLPDMSLPTPPSSHHSCIKVATETLNMLYEIPTIHIDVNIKQTTLDQVLNATSRAVHTCHGLISCHCSPKDFHLPVLIATILSKVLVWYQAVAWIQDGEQQPKVIVDDDNMGWAMKNHLVHGPLQKLNDVVYLFCDGFKSRDHHHSMHGTMGSFLKTRLQFTMRELDRRLGPGAS